MSLRKSRRDAIAVFERARKKPHTDSHTDDNQKKRGLTGDLDNPLSLFEIFGGAEGDRTPGLMTASHALSQLSYSPDLYPAK